jgi:hypothetical protein
MLHWIWARLVTGQGIPGKSIFESLSLQQFNLVHFPGFGFLASNRCLAEAAKALHPVV